MVNSYSDGKQCQQGYLLFRYEIIKKISTKVTFLQI